MKKMKKLSNLERVRLFALIICALNCIPGLNIFFTMLGLLVVEEADELNLSERWAWSCLFLSIAAFSIFLFISGSN